MPPPIENWFAPQCPPPPLPKKKWCLAPTLGLYLAYIPHSRDIILYFFYISTKSWCHNGYRPPKPESPPPRELCAGGLCRPGTLSAADTLSPAL